MTSTSFDAEFARWRADAEAIDLVAFVQGRGHKLTRQGREWVGPCPNCGGVDRFSINPIERVFNCRGFGGGGYIDAVMHILDCSFLQACEEMTGRPPPPRPQRARRVSAEPKRRDDAQADEQPVAKAVEHDQASRPHAGAQVSEQEKDDHQRQTPADLFASGLPIAGTHAAAYLAARGIPATPGWTFDMRFHMALPYIGQAAPDDREETLLGKFPALLCAVRNARGEIIGVHRTYLDPREPRKMTPPPGTERINGAKKILGRVKGGAIRLSDHVGPVMVIGEGMETTRSAALLGIGGGDAAYWCAVSLGNLAGSATGSLPHPTIQKRTIPNGEPDPDRPGLILPPEVEEVIILGDGDSDRPTTWAHLLVAGRRWQAEGRQVFYALAPDGRDWNDVVSEEATG